jgi:hypothetical protein
LGCRNGLSVVSVDEQAARAINSVAPKDAILMCVLFEVGGAVGVGQRRTGIGAIPSAA